MCCNPARVYILWASFHTLRPHHHSVVLISTLQVPSWLLLSPAGSTDRYWFNGFSWISWLFFIWSLPELKSACFCTSGVSSSYKFWPPFQKGPTAKRKGWQSWFSLFLFPLSPLASRLDPGPSHGPHHSRPPYTLPTSIMGGIIFHLKT